jgi:hypothetical protein
VAKILPANLAPDALPRVRGVLLTRISRGVIVAQAWPRKRGRMTNPKVIFTSKQFSLAAQMAANPEPMSLITAMFLTKGSDWMPRDLLVRAAFGKAYEITLPDGTLATQNSHAPPAPGTRLWIPTDLGAALQAWYRADLLTGAEGSPVTTWPDQSIHGYHATKPGSTVNLHLADLNGLNTVAFPGSSPGWLNLPYIFNGKTAGAAFAVLKRFQEPPPNSTQAGWWRMGTSASADHFPWTDSLVYDGFCSTVRKGYGNPAPSLTAWRIVGWHSKAADHGIFIDGTSFNSTTTNTFGATSAPTLGASIGNTMFFRGWLAECWFLDAKPSLADRQKCEGYIAWKWALQANLPASHPYKSTPPLN